MQGTDPRIGSILLENSVFSSGALECVILLELQFMINGRKHKPNQDILTKSYCFSSHVVSVSDDLSR